MKTLLHPNVSWNKNTLNAIDKIFSAKLKSVYLWSINKQCLKVVYSILTCKCKLSVGFSYKTSSKEKHGERERKRER